MSRPGGDPGGSGSAGRMRPWRDLRWVLLVGAAAAALAVGGLSVELSRVPLATVAALVGLGVVGELAGPGGAATGPGPWGLGIVFAGAAGLLSGAPAAPWAALAVGLSGLLQRRLPRDVLADTSLLVLIVGVVAVVGEAAVGVLAQGVVLAGSATVVGEPAPPIALSSVLLGGVVAAPLLQVGRRMRARLDRRRSAVGLQARLRERWPADVATAATMALAAALWAVHPVLTLLLLLPALVAMRRSVPTPGGAGGAVEREGGASLLRTAVLTELRRAAELDRPVAVLHVLVDGDPSEIAVTAVGERLAGTVRDYDVVGRVGPAALAVVLPEADRTTGTAAAERLLGVVTAEPLPGGNGEAGREPAVSVGVAASPGDAAAREDLLVEAEVAAEAARAQGGDRVLWAGDLPEGFARERGRSAVVPPGAGTGGAGRPVERDSLVQVARTALGRGTDAPRRLLLGAAGAAAVAAAVAVLVVGPRIAWMRTDAVELLVFAGVAVAAEGLATSIAGRAAVSWTALPLIGIAVLPASSPLAVVAVALAAGLAGGWLRGVTPQQLAFNTATFVLAGLAALLAAGMAAPVFGDGAAAAVATGLVGGLGFVAADTMLVVVMLAASFELPAETVWRQDLQWMAAHQFGMSLLAGVVAHLHADLGGAALVLLALPAAALHRSLDRIVRRSTRSVARLRERDEELDAANDRLEAVNDRLTGALTGLSRGYLDTLASLAVIVERKDGYDGSHVDRVVAYGRRLLEAVDPALARDDTLLWGFRLHDVGKIGLPDELLGSPQPFDDEDWELMRTHPRRGVDLVAGVSFLAPVRQVILHHHEWWDGTGYPFGLAGAAIPLAARVLAIVDAFDAMTRDRPYREALGLEEAFHELVRGQGSQFDPDLVETFVGLSQETLDAIRRDAADQPTTTGTLRALRDLVRRPGRGEPVDGPGAEGPEAEGPVEGARSPPAGAGPE